uniref:Uncharacterized protein n=1 Tax=Setaria viridis TaxID=4556 RepID=A0A4U6V5M6_SETVI|nr:hypothetical protein SEVIR_3G053966v2 [Setaria viridis]
MRDDSLRCHLQMFREAGDRKSHQSAESMGCKAQPVYARTTTCNKVQATSRFRPWQLSPAIG